MLAWPAEPKGARRLTCLSGAGCVAYQRGRTSGMGLLEKLMSLVGSKAPPDGPPVPLIVTRTSQWGTNRFAACQILIDGEEVASINSGESLTLQVPSGRRKIVAKMGLAKSRPLVLDIKQGYGQRVTVGVSRLAGMIPPLRFLIRYLYVRRG